MEKYYIIVENTEEEILFDGWMENVPSIEELKNAIENHFLIVLGHYYIATEKPINFHDNCIVFYK